MSLRISRCSIYAVMTRRSFSIAVLIISQIAVLSVWFSSSAVLSEMATEASLNTADLAWLSTATQVGFAFGAILFGLAGWADRYDPRKVFAISALMSAGANAMLLYAPIGGWEAVTLRALTGAFLAGVYPVGMKVAVGWTIRNRGLLVGSLVGALTLGSAAPHLIAFSGGADWRITIVVSSLIAASGGIAMLAVGLGPHHARAPRLDLSAIGLAWTNPRIRYAILGYIGHMWELYAFWAWVGVIAGTSFAISGADPDGSLAKLTAFLAIALGGFVCIPAGGLADRFGKASVAAIVLILSTGSALAAALAYGGPVWLMITILIIWGLTVIPDSALFSALVADAAPPERVGSLMTLQTALGFLLTAFTVQITPLAAELFGWPIVLAIMGIGPALGVIAMRTLQRLGGQA
ncbi:MAG: MFS transporter [Pseudomonadota bacterium]